MSSSTPAAVSTLFVKSRNNSTARYLEWLAQKIGTGLAQNILGPVKGNKLGT